MRFVDMSAPVWAYLKGVLGCKKTFFVIRTALNRSKPSPMSGGKTRGVYKELVRSVIDHGSHSV